MPKPLVRKASTPTPSGKVKPLSHQNMGLGHEAPDLPNQSQESTALDSLLDSQVKSFGTLAPAHPRPSGLNVDSLKGFLGTKGPSMTVQRQFSGEVVAFRQKHRSRVMHAVGDVTGDKSMYTPRKPRATETAAPDNHTNQGSGIPLGAGWTAWNPGTQALPSTRGLRSPWALPGRSA